MKLKVALFSIVILTALFLSAFGSPAPVSNVQLQDTVVPPAVTVNPPTVVVVTTPGQIPVTGADNPGIWTIVLFALLGLLAIAFLVALFSPRAVREDIDRNPPPDV